MREEGWYLDPFHLHEARWISDRVPTALVRDGGVEDQDPPPDGSFDGVLEPVAVVEEPDGEDLLRADAERGEGVIFDPNAAVGGPWEDEQRT